MLSRLPLKDRALGRWLGILPALGIRKSFLTGKHGPCPMCGGKDRWRWDNREGRGTWICSKCGAGDGIALVMQINGWKFREAAKQIETIIGSVSTYEPKRERSDREKRDAMNKLWRSGKTIEANDPVGRYLARRVGLTSFPSCLRTASDLRYQSDWPSFHPAMIAMVTGPDGAPSILHRTYLTADGRKASVDAPRRMMPGTVAKGSAIRLAPPIDALGIAEGIETALSASALFGIPCWAAANAGMLAAWQPPPEVKRIIIFGDNDPGYEGQAAAYALARRLRSDKCTVEVHVPADSGADWNDVHRLQLNAASDAGGPTTNRSVPEPGSSLHRLEAWGLLRRSRSGVFDPRVARPAQCSAPPAEPPGGVE
jgi:putative DNA primase/helicase